MDSAEYDGLLDLTYACAVEPERCPVLLQRLGESVGAPYATLIRQNEVTGKGYGVRWNIDPAVAEPYYGYFATRNPLHNTPDPAAAIRRWRPRILTDEHKLPKSELMRTEYYNDHMRRWDFHSTLMIRLALEGMDTLTINLMRPKTREQFGPEEIGILERVHPHLIRAAHLSQKAGEARRVGDGLMAWMDRSADAFFQLFADGRIAHMNEAGRRLLTQAALINRGSQLEAARPSERATLARLIAAATSADGPRAGGAMTLARAGHKRPWCVTVAPLRTRDGGAVVLVSDLDGGEPPREQVLRDAFGLTPAEVRVAAALFEGATLRDIADANRVSLNTVRNQLTAIFDKTETGRQSELVRLMASTAKRELT